MQVGVHSMPQCVEENKDTALSLYMHMQETDNWMPGVHESEQHTFHYVFSVPL